MQSSSSLNPKLEKFTDLMYIFKYPSKIYPKHALVFFGESSQKVNIQISVQNTFLSVASYIHWHVIRLHAKKHHLELSSYNFDFSG